MSSRGMAKWAPFAPISEQYQNFQSLVKETSKETFKTLDQEQIEEVDMAIQKAHVSKKQVRITYYNEGFYEKIIAVVMKMNTYNGTVLVKTGGEELNLLFDHIYHVAFM